MKVSLISYTPDAVTLLLRTKNTRLGFNSDPASWSESERAEHLAYMRDTIKSSWEFVDYVFEIEGVSRAFTHQLVRTRQGSYAQESQRTVDVADHDTVIPDAFTGENAQLGLMFMEGVDAAMETYQTLMVAGALPQDARAILPTNISTNIFAKFNLRTMSEMAKLRLCTRTQGEYQNVFRLMRAAVLEQHPWAAEFIEVYCAAHGTCAFPRYGATSCPLFKYTIPLATLDAARAAVREHADTERFEAKPVAVAGRSM